MTATRQPMFDGPLVAGIDVGGTKTSVVVVDGRDRVLYERVAPTDRASLVRANASAANSSAAALVASFRANNRARAVRVGVKRGSLSPSFHCAKAINAVSSASPMRCRVCNQSRAISFEV